ncbi:MAG: universal stress protein [Deltaproteobacteria bacterium]|nr:universal stress protein [Deltaproteobacteria bacterium]
MAIVNRILYPVDLSDASSKIVDYVKEMADTFNAEIYTIIVAHVTDYYSSIEMPYTLMNNFEIEIIKGAEKQITAFVNTHFSDRTVETKVVPGHPGEEILNFSKEQNIDLVIMGTHGRKGLGRIIFGSVANYVVKNARIPVLTLHPYQSD